MSRSGYSDDCYGWDFIRWRGAVASAIRGKRGQAFLREMAEAMDAMPVKALIAHDLERDGNVCAIGAVGRRRGVEMSNLDPYAYEDMAKTFGVSEALVREIEYINDEASPERRWQIVRKWIDKQLSKPVTAERIGT